MSTQSVFIEPIDVLILRGNKLFGNPGSYGESLIPPWPSVAAGALRSRILVDDGVDLADFARGNINHPTLGTPAQPGTFAITAFHLARRKADGQVERLVAAPADLSIGKTNNDSLIVGSLTPTPAHAGLASSAPLSLLPILAETTRSKPESGYWLSEIAWAHYLAGKPIPTHELISSRDLWKIDERVGVGLSPATRAAEEGKLFSTQAVAFSPNVGFITDVIVATLPRDGLLRFGGDGRGCALHPASATPLEPDYAALTHARRCKLILQSPGLFTQGWLPNGITQNTDGSYRFDLHGVRAKLICAAVPRAEVISGWDLAQWQPKAAQRVAPTGSVYWLDELEATPEALRKLAEQGLWSTTCEDAARRAEGFNRFTFAHY
jgi:CRISPR-associated protein Cmr3